MVNKEKGGIDECEWFLESLELARLNDGEVVERNGMLALMPAKAAGHAERCGGCAEALEDFVETRKLLLVSPEESRVVEPGPWFASKVMSAIAERENEIAERDGVWQSVMKLAPRLAAVCALVLVLAGSWAVETRRELAAKQMRQPGESLFEASPAALDDDVLASVGAQR